MWEYIHKKLVFVVVTSMAVAGGGMQHHDARAAGAHGKLVPHTQNVAEHKDHHAAAAEDVDTERFATGVSCERLSQSTSMSDGTGGDCCVASCSIIANIAFVAEVSRPELRSIFGAWSGNALLAADVRADDPPPR